MEVQVPEALLVSLLAFAALAAGLTALSLVFEALLNYIDRQRSGSSRPSAARKRFFRQRALARLERQRRMKNPDGGRRARCVSIAWWPAQNGHP
jgi:hypothetical protein